MKRAKYVDRLRYFEDAPTLGSSEANTIDKLDEAYYSPFETRNFNPIPVSTITCEHFRNPYDCQSGGPCGWDGRLMSCFIVHGPVNLKTFSFKEKMSNRKKKIIFFKK